MHDESSRLHTTWWCHFLQRFRLTRSLTPVTHKQKQVTTHPDVLHVNKAKKTKKLCLHAYCFFFLSFLWLGILFTNIFMFFFRMDSSVKTNLPPYWLFSFTNLNISAHQIILDVKQRQTKLIKKRFLLFWEKDYLKPTWAYVKEIYPKPNNRFWSLLLLQLHSSI